MSAVYRCDRCKKIIELAWTITAKYQGQNPYATYVEPKSFDLCSDCAIALDKWRENGA